MITLPRRSTDTWLLAALFPELRANAEEHPDPVGELAARQVLPEGRKQEHIYVEKEPIITRELTALREQLPELDRFVRKLEALAATSGA